MTSLIPLLLSSLGVLVSAYFYRASDRNRRDALAYLQRAESIHALSEAARDNAALAYLCAAMVSQIGTHPAPPLIRGSERVS